MYAWSAQFHVFSYGDQAFFVTQKTFSELNGFDESVPFEDSDFYARLKKKHEPVILDKYVVTSARRFSKVGDLKQKGINVLLITLYGLGFNILP